MSFLPDDYEAPKTGNYMRFVEGENKFRILSKPILGWLDWSADKKPIRYIYSPKAPKSQVESRPCKHFWAFVVYNYGEGKIQVLEIAQATIRNDLEKISNDADWGAPFFYDIKVIKTGQDTKTKYTVTPLPHKPLSSQIKLAFEETPCCLEALFENGNPFDLNAEREPTEGIFSQEDLQKPSAFSRMEELRELLAIDFISTQYLEEYLKGRAKEKNLALEQVIAGALMKEILPKFKSAYSKWLAETKPLEEAVPF